MKRQRWDSSWLCMIIEPQVPCHVGLPDKTALSGEQNLWGMSDLLQLMKLYPSWNFPAGPSSEESAFQYRGWGFDRWSRKIPHAMGQLGLSTSATESVFQSPGATTTEPTGPKARNKRSRCKRNHILQLGSSPCSSEGQAQPNRK